jgi:hypothetical protein
MSVRLAPTAAAAANACTNRNPVVVQNSQYGFELGGNVAVEGQLYFFISHGCGNVHSYVARIYVGSTLVGSTGSCKCPWRCKDAALKVWGEANMAARREARAAE